MLSKCKHSGLEQAPTEMKNLHFHPYAINQPVHTGAAAAAGSAASLLSTDGHMKAGKFAPSQEIKERVS